MEDGYKNYSDVYIRNVIVAFCSYMKNSIYVEQVVNNSIQKKYVPFYYSSTGNDQFLTDNFIDSENYNDVSDPVIGSSNVIPSGRIMLTSAGISGEDISGGYNRIKYSKYIETDFADEIHNMSSFAYMFPMAFNFDVSVKSSKELERFKIFQAIIMWMNRLKKFYFKYAGVERIPCVVTFPDDYNMQKAFQFGTPSDDKRPLVEFSVTLKTLFPFIDYSTERDSREVIHQFTNTIKVNTK